MEQGSENSKERKRIYDEIVERPEKKIKAIIGFNTLAFLMYAPTVLLYGGNRGGAEVFAIMTAHIFLCLILAIKEAVIKNIWNVLAYILSVFLVTVLGCGGCAIVYH